MLLFGSLHTYLWDQEHTYHDSGSPTATASLVVVFTCLVGGVERLTFSTLATSATTVAGGPLDDATGVGATEPVACGGERDSHSGRLGQSQERQVLSECRQRIGDQGARTEVEIGRHKDRVDMIVAFGERRCE